ncbi:MAG: histidine kinase [Cyclobacteriaceae bacterium]|nr:histidine kinase [Cyclobacteriaceae bacterium]
MPAPSLPISRMIIAYLAWWTLWGALQTMLLMQWGFGFDTAMKDALVTQLIFAMAGYTINTSMHSYRPSGRNAIYVVGWSVALAAICVYLQRETLMRMIDYPEYLAFLGDSTVIRGAFGWLNIMLIAVLTWFWVYVKEKQESEDRRNEAIKLARETELSNLRQQLQPHFLFNSLNSISALTLSHPEEARKMIQQLSDFLRGTIRKDDKAFVTLDEELKHLQLYLDIERVRFGHRLNTQITCDESLRQLKLPALLLQPVVENAIKFGLYDTTGDITIQLVARSEGSILELEVTNPYDEATSSRTGTGFGLTAVQRRLDLLFNRGDLIKTSRQNNLFTTLLRIPQSA